MTNCTGESSNSSLCALPNDEYGEVARGGALYIETVQNSFARWSTTGKKVYFYRYRRCPKGLFMVTRIYR